MGFRTDPGTPLGTGAPLMELMEEVRERFIMDSSLTEEFIPLFILPGLQRGGDIIRQSNDEPQCLSDVEVDYYREK